eukprot:12715-Heterococcus_DN1.PRE.1
MARAAPDIQQLGKLLQSSLGNCNTQLQSGTTWTLAQDTPRFDDSLQYCEAAILCLTQLWPYVPVNKYAHVREHRGCKRVVLLFATFMYKMAPDTNLETTHIVEAAFQRVAHSNKTGRSQADRHTNTSACICAL